MTKTKLKIIFLLFTIVIGLCTTVYYSLFRSSEKEQKNVAVLKSNYRAEKIGLQFIVNSSGMAFSEQTQIRKRLTAIVEELNGYYRNSRVYLTATINHIEFVPIISKDVVMLLEDMHFGRRSFRSLYKTADEYGADFSIAIVDDIFANNRKICGRGYDVNQTIEELSAINRSVAVMQLACGAHTLAHELGHLMGLNHGYKIDYCLPKFGHKSAITPYANGYAEGNCDGESQTGEFGTIMVGGFIRTINGLNKNKLEVFSNPEIFHEDCGKNRRCGDQKFGNSARALNEYAEIYASHAEPDVHTLDYSDEKLKECIQNSHRGEEISELQQLECSNFGIHDLGGIQQLIGLETLDLSHNPISVLTPLVNLARKNLQRVVLKGNMEVSCEQVLTLQNFAKNLQIIGLEHCLGR